MEKKSLRHVAMVESFLKLKSCKGDRKKKPKRSDFPVYDSAEEQNGNPYFSSIVRQFKWPSLSRKIVEIQKFCYHGNVTSLLFGK